MKTTPPPAPPGNTRRGLSLLAAGTLLLPSLALAATQTNWIAFNDHVPSNLTAPNVTAYNMRGWALAGDAGTAYPLSGPLTNYSNHGYPAGTGLAAILECGNRDQRPSLFPNATLAEPDADTPAYDLFLPGGNRILDLANAGSSVGLGTFTVPNPLSRDSQLLTFKNLNPAMRYSFRGTAIRKGPPFGANHPGRWTYCKLEGADAFTDAHTAGCITKDTPLPEFFSARANVTFPAVNFAPGEAVFQSGINTQGDMIGYDDIQPGADGTFSVLVRGWCGVVTNRYLNMGTDAAVSASVTITNGFDLIGYGLAAIQLIEYGSDELALAGQPPALTTVGELSPVSIDPGGVTGIGVTYQWYRDGVGSLDDATRRIFSLSAARPSDSGDYYLVATSGGLSVTSQVARLTVTPDLTPPSVVSASPDPLNPFHSLVVRFSEPVVAEDAGDNSFYSVVNANGDEVIVNNTPAPVVSADGRSVVLSVGQLEPWTVYHVTVSALTDLVGNEIVDGTRDLVVPLGRGWLRFDYFDAIGGTAVAPLKTDPRFPRNPTTNYFMSGFDSRTFFPAASDGLHENYGAHITGFFVPQEDGDYIFRLGSDDASQLYFNPTGDDALGVLPTPIAEETGCCGNFNKISSAFTLEAGKRYYLEGFLKEGGGGDYIHVGIEKVGVPFGNVAMGQLVVASANDPAGQPTITITQQPADQTNFVNARFTFSVEAGNSGGLPQYYVWRKNGREIPFATNRVYTTPPLTAADDESLFDCIVSIPGNASLSAAAKVSVVPDTTPPSVVRVSASSNPRILIVAFNEVMSPDGIDNSYFVVDGGAVQVLSAVLDATGTNIVLTLGEALPFGTTHTVSVNEVADASGNVVESSDHTVNTFVVSRGFAKQELYLNIGGGVNVTDLTANPKYPNSPDVVEYITSLEGPLDKYDNYGARVSGWLLPPQDGNYSFWMSSDDGGALYLSTDASVEEKVLIAREPVWNASRQYKTTTRRNAAAPENASKTLFPDGIPLTRDDIYYFELLMKEGGGGDNSSAAWQMPDGPEPVDGSAPIAGTYLAVVADPTGASVTITQQPASVLAVVNPRSDPTLALLADFSEGPGDFTVVTPQPFDGPWTYDAATGSWKEEGQAAENSRPNTSMLNSPPLTIGASGTLFLEFSHRYSFEYDGTAWDGGQVRISVNGGPFTTVPATAFSENGYNGSIASGSASELKGQPGFISTSPGHGAAEFLTVKADLGDLQAGDVVRVQFIASADTNTKGSSPNWEIQTFSLSIGVRVTPVVTFRVGATAQVNFQPSTLLAYQWQRDDGDGFLDIAGATGPTYSQTVTAVNDGNRFRCLVFTVGASAISSEATVQITVPLKFATVGGNQIITWPSVDPLAFTLQGANDLRVPAADTVWTTIAAPVEDAGDVKKVTLPLPAGGYRFYRLVR